MKERQDKLGVLRVCGFFFLWDNTCSTSILAEASACIFWLHIWPLSIFMPLEQSFLKRIPTPGPWQEQCRTGWEGCVKGNQLLVHPGFIQTSLAKPFQKLPALLPCCCRSGSAEWLMSKAENSVSYSSETWVTAREIHSPWRTENCLALGQPVNLSKWSLWYLGDDCSLRPWFNRGLSHIGP